MIQPGEERRLSGPIVVRTLEPLLAAMRAKAKEEDPSLDDPQPSSEALLGLKVCDPAMGSGAFLVEACRFLAKQVHAAWVREGTLPAMVREAAKDDVIKRDPERLAQRMVAQRCLYGVDKNPLAVELGKLSLWLLTLSRGQTFAFLDHCLKAGDSLVGLDRAQILAMDWEVGGAEGRGVDISGGQQDFFNDQARRAFDRATSARQRLGDLSRTGDRDGVESEQHALHVEAEWELERLRDVADVLVSAFFWPHDDVATLRPEFLFEAKKPSAKDRRGCLRRLRDELNGWLIRADGGAMPAELRLRRELTREGIRPFHWHLEFPEVFDEGRVDPLAVAVAGGEGGKVWMDAVVGNPPFAGKNNITATGGPTYLDWLGDAYPGSHGNSDLSAYFFRRAHSILGDHGTMGLIATNTIGQGDTRASGLQPLVAGGARIYEATRSMKWPVKGANVSVSVVHLAVGTAEHVGLECRLDGLRAEAVNSRLRPKPERADPVRLGANAGRSFQGSIVLGKGFVLSPEERDALVASDPRNGERIFPYLGGEELNSSPTQSHRRYVIDFGDISEKEASRWPDLLAILRQKVKPERDRLKDNPDGRRRKKSWWLFGRHTPTLYRTVRTLDRCLACSRVSKYCVVAFQETSHLFSEQLVIFAFDTTAHFGLLQSRIHERWARLQGSSMRNDLRYTPTDCFETFPFPPASTLTPTAPLETIAATLYSTRAAFMVATDKGLTKTYNALKDPEDTRPEILELRELHEQLDRAVLDAYGQSQILVPPYCGADPQALERFEDEVLDFLFARNETLAKKEARAAKRAQS